VSMSNPTDRVEIITSVQRRRRWTADPGRSPERLVGWSMDRLLGWFPHTSRGWIELIIVTVLLWLLMVAIFELELV